MERIIRQLFVYDPMVSFFVVVSLVVAIVGFCVVGVLSFLREHPTKIIADIITASAIMIIFFIVCIILSVVVFAYHFVLFKFILPKCRLRISEES